MAKMKRSNSGSGRARLALAAVLFTATATAAAQQNLETKFRTTGDAVTSLFASQRDVIQASSAVLYDGRKEIAYGTVVSADGYILTKASEVDGVSKIDVRVNVDSFKDAKVVMTDAGWDVALLKVDAVNLTPVVFAPDSKLERGTWVIVNGATGK
jgi:S1-C subfamily serine protease